MKRPLAILVPLSLAAVASTGAAALHVRLVRSEPAAGATLTAAPAALRLWFSERVQLAVTTVRLTGPGGAVELGAPRLDEGDPPAVVLDVKGALRPGTQRITWRTMARDGHPASGGFSFTLGAPPTGRPTPTPVRR